MSIANTFYNYIVRRNSIYVGTIFGTAFGFGIAFNMVTDYWWKQNNQGKLWEDVREKHAKADDEDDSE
ncbi:qcr9 subunit 9 of the ubiquinol cytochrome-c reductase complex [Malassezia sp. CBS 17886]|nr:qcr9 subunit 9 of the ubiquinol cytochrome-c reductase complex [Malassezia sp. CBS 17886]